MDTDGRWWKAPKMGMESQADRYAGQIQMIRERRPIVERSTRDEWQDAMQALGTQGIPPPRLAARPVPNPLV
jgi:hypothetical protein